MAKVDHLDHLRVLQQGVDVWNTWRRNNPLIRPNLSGADLASANLSRANLDEARLIGADLCSANLVDASLRGANVSQANLSRADLLEADLRGASFSGASLKGARLIGANLTDVDLTGADLRGANLERAILVATNLANADLTHCRIHGVSAWDLNLQGAKQKSLVITRSGQPEITIDNIEVGQFIYLLINNEKIRDVIDTISSKIVLILGRFTPERKAFLDALREELRRRNYLPVLFDFDKPVSKNLTETILTLAHAARFVIVDLTDPSAVTYELASLIPNAVVPVQPILLLGQSEAPMLIDLRKRYSWVLEPYRYNTPERLISDLSERVIRPAEAKLLELRQEEQSNAVYRHARIHTRSERLKHIFGP